MICKKELLLDEALQLPAGDRAEFAAKLIESLAGETNAEVDAAWAEEIKRRCAAVDAGESVTSDWETVRRRIELLSRPDEERRRESRMKTQEEMMSARKATRAS